MNRLDLSNWNNLYIPPPGDPAYQTYWYDGVFSVHPRVVKLTPNFKFYAGDGFPSYRIRPDGYTHTWHAVCIGSKDAATGEIYTTAELRELYDGTNADAPIETYVWEKAGVTVTATKTWVGEGEPVPIYLQLNRHLGINGAPVAVPGLEWVTLPAADGQWQHSWSGMERYYRGNPNYPWVYTVREMPVVYDALGNEIRPNRFSPKPPANYLLTTTREEAANGNVTIELTNTKVAPLPPTADGDLSTKPCAVQWQAQTTHSVYELTHHDMKVSPFMKGEPGSNMFSERTPKSAGALSIASFRIGNSLVYRFVHGTQSDVQDGVLTVDLNPLIDGLKGTGYELDYRTWGPVTNWAEVDGGRFIKRGAFITGVSPRNTANENVLGYVTGTPDYNTLIPIDPTPDNMSFDDNNGALHDGKFYINTPYMAASTAYVFELILPIVPTDPVPPNYMQTEFFMSGHRFTIKADFTGNYRCVMGEKAWLGNLPTADTVQLQLYQVDPANPNVEVAYGDPVTVSAQGKVMPMGQQPAVTLPPWTMLWTQLPIKPEGADNDPANRYTYTVKEVPQPDKFELVSTESVDVDDPGSAFGPHITKVTLTNRPLKSIAVTKTWENSTNLPNPDSVRVELIRDGAAMTPAVTAELSAANQWAHTFEKLPAVDDTGKAYAYTVAETVPTEYQATQTVDPTTGAVQLVNTRIVRPTAAPLPTDPPAPTYPTLQVPLTAKKVLKNGTLKAGDYTFVLKDAKGNVLAEVGNFQDGTIVFPNRTFSRAVTNYTYTITEKAGLDSNVTYDATVYTVKITTTPQSGVLQAKVDILKDGTPYAGDVVFTNVRHVPPTGDSAPTTMLLLAIAAMAMLGGAMLINRKRKTT